VNGAFAALQSCSALSLLAGPIGLGPTFPFLYGRANGAGTAGFLLPLCSFLSGSRLKHFFSELHHQTELPLFDELKFLLRLKLGAKRVEKLLFMYGGTVAV
jgi:hypothetical protein